MTADKENLSTENQPKGSARNLSDTLDRHNEDVDPGQRQWSADSRKKPDNATGAGEEYAKQDADAPEEHIRSS